MTSGPMRLVDRLSQEFCFGIVSDTACDAQILHMVQKAPLAPEPAQREARGVRAQTWSTH